MAFGFMTPEGAEQEEEEGIKRTTIKLNRSFDPSFGFSSSE
jgi:hypothetical protein